MANRNGLYIQPDYWLAVEHLPIAQQDKALGAMVRLFFTGEECPPKGGAARTAYYCVRDRVMGARNKAFGKDDGDDENLPENPPEPDPENAPENAPESGQETDGKSTGNDQQTDGKRTANFDSSIKEGEGDITCIDLSGCNSVSTEGNQPGSDSQVDTGPAEPITDSSKFVASALTIFTEETGRACLMPSGTIIGYLERIHDAGYTLDDIRAVCANQNRRWKDDRANERYIRPETLFKPSKFESYLMSARNNPEVIVDEQAAEFAGVF